MDFHSYIHLCLQSTPDVSGLLCFVHLLYDFIWFYPDFPWFSLIYCNFLWFLPNFPDFFWFFLIFARLFWNFTETLGFLHKGHPVSFMYLSLVQIERSIISMYPWCTHTVYMQSHLWPLPWDWEYTLSTSVVIDSYYSTCMHLELDRSSTLATYHPLSLYHTIHTQPSYKLHYNILVIHSWWQYVVLMMPLIGWRW